MRPTELHLPRDFSQGAFSGDMSGNSADISKGYFCKPIGSSNPSWSASKSPILMEKIEIAKLCRDFRRLLAELARVGHWESEFLAPCGFNLGRFSERDFASGFLLQHSSKGRASHQPTVNPLTGARAVPYTVANEFLAIAAVEPDQLSPFPIGEALGELQD
jgi:hypothetical protein